MRSRSTGWAAALVFGVLALAVGGCGSLSGGVHTDALALAAAPGAVLGGTASTDAAIAEPLSGAESGPASDTSLAAPAEAVVAAADERQTAVGDASAASPAEVTFEPISGDNVSPLVVALADSVLLAQASRGAAAEEVIEEYDPLEGFNEVMFEFNRKLDRYLIKPVAKAYNFVMPDELQRMVDRGFTNINFIPRVVNNMLQGKWAGAGRELTRFLINSVVGFGGLWDMARQEWNIQPSKADFGQTLGKWGAGPGAYLILPFLPPLTVRDGIGYAVDGAMDPLSYVLPFIWDRLGMKIGETINDRSLNLDLFQGFEETTVDFYAAVRNAYLQRRYTLIHEDQ